MPDLYREVSVGRSSDCDIYLAPSCQYASGHHATLYMDGPQLMYRDNSTNGTMINNIKVHRRAIPINHGDVIMIAGQYQLAWNQIDAYFPPQSVSPQPVHYPTSVTPGPSTPSRSAGDEGRLPGWSWGAFGWYQIWGFWNGCWWAFLVGMFLGWLFPLPNILFGIYGAKWSWENKNWGSMQRFLDVQKAWDIAGIIMFCIGLVSTIAFWASFV